MNKLVGCLVTKNEEEFIEMALCGLDFMDEIYVIDNQSSDKTLEIAKKHKKVKIILVNINLPHSVGTQRNEVLKYVDDSDWIYFSDGDEFITPKLAKEILLKTKNSNNCEAFQIPRLNYFLGKPLKYGGWYPDYQLRLIKKENLVNWVQGPLNLPAVIYDNEFSALSEIASGPHDKPLLKNGTNVGKLINPYLHFNHRGINSMLNKTIRFNDSEILFLIEKNKIVTPSSFKLIMTPIKEFIRRYFYHRGFLDGKEGLIESLFQAFSLFIFEARKWEEGLSPKLTEKYKIYKNECIQKIKK